MKVIENKTEEVVVITLIEPMDGGKPTHYIINNTSPKTLNTTYNDVEDWKESITINSIYYGKDNIEHGLITDLGDIKLVNELNTVKGGKCRADNKDKIL